MNPAIEVNGLVKNYRDVPAVKGISFSVGEGELFALLGENGAGKSTTINILCTILKKTAGEARILGHTLGKEDDAREEGGENGKNSLSHVHFRSANLTNFGQKPLGGKKK